MTSFYSYINSTGQFATVATFQSKSLVLDVLKAKLLFKDFNIAVLFKSRVRAGKAWSKHPGKVFYT